MRNYVGSGDRVTLTAPAGGVLTGVGYVIGTIFCVAVDSQPVGRPFSGVRNGIVSLPKPTATAITEGQRLWWDNTAKRVETSSLAGRFLIGAAGAAAAANATTVEVCLDGISVVAV